jgi:hypothetical protein
MKNNFTIRVWLFSDTDKNEFNDSATLYATNEESAKLAIKYAIAEYQPWNIERIQITNELKDSNGVELIKTINLDDSTFFNLLNRDSNKENPDNVASVVSWVTLRQASHILNF